MDPHAIGNEFRGAGALVTGGGGGMGEAVALALSVAGARVTVLDRKPPPAAFRERAGIDYREIDLTDHAGVAALIDEAARRAPLRYLANCAGVLWFDRDRSFAEIELSVWNQVMAINLTALMNVARATVPHMLGAGGGAMVHISSIQALRGDARPQDAYAASKAALIALSKSIAVQYAPRAIRSNVILPGPTLTPMQERWQGDAEVQRAIADFVPLKRIGRPEDMANACLFLLSDRAAFITGTELAVDGGLTARL
jgi:NAD(P)-dependent dehydrogenase (short-subunit alcohol dehydrogenase family)